VTGTPAVFVLGNVAGVILSLCGLGLLLMGVMAMAARSWRGGASLAGAGVVLLLVGFWLVGVIG
jgi:hypothetical protein